MLGKQQNMTTIRIRWLNEKFNVRKIVLIYIDVCIYEEKRMRTVPICA